MTEPDTTPFPPDREIVAAAGTYYRNTRYLMSLLLIAGGLWFLYDGLVTYPRHNAEIARIEAARIDAERAGDQAKASDLTGQRMKLRDRHTETDIQLQKTLGFALPPLGLALLAWTLRNSRGRFRLTPDNILHAPGHPPVPLADITALDTRLWDRKGIARATYQLPTGQSAVIKLDDFLYQRPPIDAIYARLKTTFQHDTPA